MVEWVQNKSLWQRKCWIFLQNKNQNSYPRKHSFIWQKAHCPWSIYPKKNGSLFFLYKIQIQGTNAKIKRYSRSPQRWPRNQTDLLTKAPWHWCHRWQFKLGRVFFKTQNWRFSGFTRSLRSVTKTKFKRYKKRARKGCDIWQKQVPLQLTKFYFAG